MNIMMTKKVVGVASSHEVYAPLSIRPAASSPRRARGLSLSKAAESGRLLNTLI
jgi:hypothetical protein